MTKMVPKAPLGPYPQSALYGQEGNAPIKSKIKIMINTVLNITSPVDIHVPTIYNEIFNV